MAKWKRSFITALALALLQLAVSGAASAQVSAHAHINHVADHRDDTPENVGLLAAAQASATVAAFQAGIAARSPGVEDMREHMGEALRAIGRRSEEWGGYGLLNAVSEAARHLAMAGDSDDASDVLRSHASHIRTSLQNVVRWGDTIVSRADELDTASGPANATVIVQEIRALVQAVLFGTDSDGDGRISWGDGEGGLEQAVLHMMLLKTLEGIESTAICDDWNTAAFFETAVLERIVACLQSGVNPNERDDESYTPLHHAARRSDNPTVILALIHAAGGREPVELPWRLFRSAPETPLQLAVEHNQDLSVIETMLAAGADPNAQPINSRGVPLYIAIWQDTRPVQDRLDLIGMLLDAGADPLRGILSDLTWNLVWYRDDPPPGSDLYDRLRAAARLIPGCEGWYDSRFWSNATAEDVTACIRGGAPVNYPIDDPIYRPMHNRLQSAARNTGDRAVVKTLLDHGAEGIQDALCVAASYTHNPGIIHDLLSAGGDALADCEDPYWQDGYPTTPLLEAIHSPGHDARPGPGILRAFLESGVDPMGEVFDHRYEVTTVFHFAARSPNRSAIAVLLDFGADPFRKDRYGRTALQYALTNDSLAGSEVLRRMLEMSQQPW